MTEISNEQRRENVKLTWEGERRSLPERIEARLTLIKSINPYSNWTPPDAPLLAEAAALIRAQEAELTGLREALDGVYSERARVVAALSKLFPASLEEHDGEDWDDDWRTACFIDLPTGQVSWHIAQADLPLFGHLPRGAGRVWDGHDTPTKYARLADLACSPLLPAPPAEAAAGLPQPGTTWIHGKYGRARVLTVGHLFCGGDALVTVEYLGSGLSSSRFLTYPIADFLQRFEEART